MKNTTSTVFNLQSCVPQHSESLKTFVSKIYKHVTYVT